MIAFRVEQSIASVSHDLEKMTGTGARISQKVDEIVEKLERLEEKTKSSLHVNEAKHIIEEITDLKNTRSEETIGPGDSAKKEIEYLLAAVKDSGFQFGHEAGKRRSAMNYYLRFYGKYKMYKKSLATADDFIDKVASKTIAGNSYYLIEDGKERPLGEWLRGILKKKREVALP